MPKIPNTEFTDQVFQDTMKKCVDLRHQFVTPEHLLYGLLEQDRFAAALDYYADLTIVVPDLNEYLSKMEKVPKDMAYQPETSQQFAQLLEAAYNIVSYSSAEKLDVPHLTRALLGLEDSWAAYMLKKELAENVEEFMGELISYYEDTDNDGEESDMEDEESHDRQQWKRLVTCLNDTVAEHHPLIGREKELERTIQVLCRKDKNNPLHVGEPGVGKTALVYGLTARIEKGDVPDRLKGCKVFQMDLGTMLAGTQFRGDFEKRIKQVMEGVQKVGNAIVYIDEIHNLVGAGRGSDGSMDASNMLKPYMEQGSIRFIGSTTYDEYNRYFSKSRGIVRRFQQIDIQEPTV